MPMETGLSQRVRNLHASPIREILAVIDRPGMISFAGGLLYNYHISILNSQNLTEVEDKSYPILEKINLLKEA